MEYRLTQIKIPGGYVSPDGWFVRNKVIPSLKAKFEAKPHKRLTREEIGVLLACALKWAESDQA